MAETVAYFTELHILLSLQLLSKLIGCLVSSLSDAACCIPFSWMCTVDASYEVLHQKLLQYWHVLQRYHCVQSVADAHRLWMPVRSFGTTYHLPTLFCHDRHTKVARHFMTANSGLQELIKHACNGPNNLDTSFQILSCCLACRFLLLSKYGDGLAELLCLL